MRETGCRPGEVRKVTAEQVNLELGVWVMAHHKTRKKTGLARVIYLTALDVANADDRPRWNPGDVFAPR